MDFAIGSKHQSTFVLAAHREAYRSPHPPASVDTLYLSSRIINIPFATRRRGGGGGGGGGLVEYRSNQGQLVYIVVIRTHSTRGRLTDALADLCIEVCTSS
jgi:hypothetical protein